MKALFSKSGFFTNPLHIFTFSIAILTIVIAVFPKKATSQVAFTGGECNGNYISISVPLNDLGSNEYISPETGPTGFTGGLYPNGSNDRPSAHEMAGVAIANQIVPLNANGQPDSVNGKIGMMSMGMSNTMQEFAPFIELVNGDPAVNDQLVLVNGATAGQASSKWVDLDSPAWVRANLEIEDAGLTPEQIQVVWVKLARFGSGNFPQFALLLQDDLEIIARNILIQYPNTKIAYYSSRTRAYAYWTGLSPEPDAFEGGFAVKWMIEKQINGDPSLNYDPANGPVEVPYFSWSAYLWADGLTPRSDGLVWTQADLEDDCIHPSANGEAKVANLLYDFFRGDVTTIPWFLGGNPPPVTSTPSLTPTAGVTSTPTATATEMPASSTPTPTSTSTASRTPSATPSLTPIVPTATVPPTETATPPTPTQTATATTVPLTETPSPTATTTPEPTPILPHIEFELYLPLLRH
jgi:hypothetical protein